MFLYIFILNISVQAKPPKPKHHKKSIGKDTFQDTLTLTECQSDSSEEDSFFGAKAKKDPLTALNKETREKTIVSIGQAERERVAKIRRAQDAASKIQRCWKRYHSKSGRR